MAWKSKDFLDLSTSHRVAFSSIRQTTSRDGYVSNQRPVAGEGQVSEHRVVTVCLRRVVLVAFMAGVLLAQTDDSSSAQRALRVGEAKEGLLTQKDSTHLDVGRVHRYAFNPATDGPVTIRLESKFFNAYLLVRDAQGQKLAVDDDRGPGDSAELVIDTDSNVAYEVLVVGRGNHAEGKYRLEAVLGKPEERTVGQNRRADVEWFQEALKEKLGLDRKLLVLLNLAGWLLNLGQPDAAEKYAAQGLRLAEEHDRLEEQALFLSRLGYATSVTNRLEKSTAFYRKALNLNRKLKDRDGEGYILEALGSIYNYRGNTKDALAYYEQALAVHRETKNRQMEGSTLGNIGSVLSRIGRFDEAMGRLEEALAIHRETGDRRGEGIVLGNIGSIQRIRGRTAASITKFEEALSIQRGLGNRRSEGILLGRLGVSYGELGYPEKAIGLYNEALKVQSLTGNRRSQGIVHANMGTMYSDLGREGKAAECYEKAVSLQRKTENPWHESESLASLAGAYLKLRRFPQSKACLERALALSRQIKNRRTEGVVLHQFAIAAGMRGDFGEALAYYQDALGIFKELKYRAHEMQVLLGIGITHRKLGLLKEGQAGVEASIAMAREMKSRVWEGRALGFLGYNQILLGREEDALRSFRASHAIAMDVFAGVDRSLETASVQSFGESESLEASGDYFMLLAKVATRAKSNSRRQDLLAEALTLQESLRARSLSSAIRAGDVRDVLSPEGKKRWDRIRYLRKRIAETQAKAFQTLPEEEEPRREVLTQLDTQVKPLDDAIAALERDLKSTERRYAELSAERQNIDPDRLSELMEPKEALLYYGVLKDRVAAFVWTPKGGLQLTLLDTSAEELKEPTEKIRSRLGPLSGGEKPAGVNDLKAKLQRLRATLLAGVEGQLKGVRRLLVVPDSTIHLLPFEALVLADGHYLVERFDVRYAPSIHALAQIADKSKTARDSPYALVAFGDPDFGKSEQAPESISLSLRGNRRFARLAHAAREMKEVSGLFNRCLLRQGKEATEGRFKREAGKGRMLHVATHGRYGGRLGYRSNVMFSSGLVLGGYHKGGDAEDDGFLSAAEVLGLDLRAVDLTVLSACQTAAGTVRGHEGKYGLERAFFIAGVKTYVGSLWQVDDEATGEFMRRFYRYLKAGRSKRDALRRVKLDFITGKATTGKGNSLAERGMVLRRKKSGKPASLAHPFYWAAFTLSGHGSEGFGKR